MAAIPVHSPGCKAALALLILAFHRYTQTIYKAVALAAGQLSAARAGAAHWAHGTNLTRFGSCWSFVEFHVVWVLYLLTKLLPLLLSASLFF